MCSLGTLIFLRENYKQPEAWCNSFGRSLVYGFVSAFPEQRIARCSYYKPWMWPPLKSWRPNTLDEKWGNEQIWSGGTHIDFPRWHVLVGDMFRIEKTVCHQRFFRDVFFFLSSNPFLVVQSF